MKTKFSNPILKFNPPNFLDNIEVIKNDSLILKLFLATKVR